MSDSAFCEALVKRKCEGSLLAKRLGFFFACLVFAMLWSVITILLSLWNCHNRKWRCFWIISYSQN